MKKITSIVSATCLAAVLGTAAPAYAADLGGDCCADLEERIAELEATTVRKGNRNVSLTLSGHVNQAVLFWDNGYESNVYVVDNANSSTRFRLVGSAQINSDWSAGYTIELGIYDARSSGVHEDVAGADGYKGGGGGNEVRERKAYWWLKSKTLGMLTVGKQDHASAGTAEVDLGGMGMPGSFNGNNYFVGFGVYTKGGVDTGINWGTAVYGYNMGGYQGQIVRYDSPTLAGFKASASWGDDDRWTVALRYANSLGDFRVAAAIGYDVNSTHKFASGINDVTNVGGSISVMHTPTGLWVDFAYSESDIDYVAGVDTDRSQWSIAAGITQKFISLGKTTLYGEYWSGKSYTDRVTLLHDDGSWWGLGAVQRIDAAAMEMYIGYRHYTYDLNSASPTAVAAGTAIDDADTVIAGARIKF